MRIWLDEFDPKMLGRPPDSDMHPTVVSQVRKAEKYGTKIVSIDFLEASMAAGKLLDSTAYILTPPPPQDGKHEQWRGNGCRCEEGGRRRRRRRRRSG